MTVETNQWERSSGLRVREGVAMVKNTMMTKVRELIVIGRSDF